MTADERDTLEAKGDRAMRRGELSAALGYFQQLVVAFPNDRTLAEKLSNLRENLQPMELTSAKSRFVPDPSAPRPGTSSPLDAAEALAARGDYAGAIAAYRQALAAKPDSQLLKERLAELFNLMQSQPPRKAPLRTAESLMEQWLERIAARRKR